jgi:hypothetical protein
MNAQATMTLKTSTITTTSAPLPGRLLRIQVSVFVDFFLFCLSFFLAVIVVTCRLFVPRILTSKMDSVVDRFLGDMVWYNDPLVALTQRQMVAEGSIGSSQR